MRLSRLVAGGCSLAAATLPVMASTEGGGGASLIEPQLGTIFWTTVTFLVLIFLLGRFAWKPLLGALQERETSIRESIEQARKDREHAEELLGQHRGLLDEARRERAEAVNVGQRDGEKLKAEILAEARKQREQLLAQTEAQVAAGMQQARAELRTITVDLAIQAAEKLLSKNLDEQTHRRLIEEYLADLEKSEGSGSLPT
jgi:F-type H+-transporting ATPase subunit b